MLLHVASLQILNRVREKNKRQQTPKDKIEDDSTEFTKTLKDRTSNSPEVPKSDGEHNIRSKQAEKQDGNRTSNSGMNNTNDGALKSDDPEKMMHQPTLQHSQ